MEDAKLVDVLRSKRKRFEKEPGLLNLVRIFWGVSGLRVIPPALRRPGQ